MKQQRFCGFCGKAALCFNTFTQNGRPEFVCGNCKRTFTSGITGNEFRYLVPDEPGRLLHLFIQHFTHQKRQEYPSQLADYFELHEIQYPTPKQLLEALCAVEP